jgi:ATP/maltotriose-dependent transcriptional regulator MalT
VFQAGRLRVAIDETRAALATARPGSALRGELLLSYAHLLLFVEKTDEATEMARAAIPLLADRTPRERSRDLLLVAVVHFMAGRTEEAMAAGRESLANARRLGDPARLAYVASMVAQDLVMCGELDAAGRLLDEAESLVVGLDIGLAEQLPSVRAEWALARGDPAHALEGFAVSLDIGLRHDMTGGALWDAAGVVVALDALGHTAATLEAGALVELEAAEQGTPLRTLRSGSDALREALDRSRATAPAASTARILAAARALPSGRRLSRVLELARRPVEPVADPKRETIGA